MNGELSNGERPPADLIAAAREWMRDDPDPETVAELAALVDRGELDELSRRFSGRLRFGTAGLRGEVGAGSSMMNTKVVMQTSAGFAQLLLGRTIRPSIVIGFDARLSSRKFALAAAQVFAGSGLSVTLLDGPVPTPILAFAVRELNATAGVMITASHNPPQDNGYKVYLGGEDAGSQIAPPVDAEIAALIDEAAAHPLAEIALDDSVVFDAQAAQAVTDVYVAKTLASGAVSGATPPRAMGATPSSAAGGTPSSAAGGTWGEPYVRGAGSTTGNVYTFADSDQRRETHTSPAPVIVYTAMHGVGFELTKRLFAEAGLPELQSVRAQQEPDGRFPTVEFPNPEEPGALDLAFELAGESAADLIIAHDPDADRLAIAIPSRDGAGYTQLTGNQVGLLLGWECAERASGGDLAASGDRPREGRGALAATVVSSPALGAVAEAYGFEFVQTLSGFKWVSRVPNLIFGFEEALGYLVNPGVVRDKDGISAAMLAAQIAARLHAQGKTLWDRLDEASARFGHYASDQITLRLASDSEVERACARIRSHPPKEFGEVAVARFVDYLEYGHMPVPANVLRFDLDDSSRVMIRPSGTEPKLKLYLDANSKDGSVEQRRDTAEGQVHALREAAQGLISRALDSPGSPA